MMPPVVLFHYGGFDPLKQHPGLVQAGPSIDANDGIQVTQPSIPLLRQLLGSNGWPEQGVLLHYTDPFLLRSIPLLGLRQWNGPRVMACGDLHHGPAPIDTLAAYLQQEPHDAVLLTFNPAWLDQVRQRLSVPVLSCPPSFFRYPKAKRLSRPMLNLLHVGTIGPHHSRRREVVESLIQRKRIAFATSLPHQHSRLQSFMQVVQWLSTFRSTTT